MITARKLSIPRDRDERLHYMHQLFPQAAGAPLQDDWQGGRHAALGRLKAVDAVTYAKNRNFINGAVTKLSPYLRHGCITLKEAVDSVQARFGLAGEKLIMELAWRDYWRQVWYARGNGILSDIEPPKVSLGNRKLPEFVTQTFTGLPCMDGIVQDLRTTGYVHNHARMWLAAYVLHWLKVDWREAADWFESQLIDGDIASNHLSWQWVASVFSSKPYYFNKENLSRFTGDYYCEKCRVECPFDASYETLNTRLFTPTSTAANVYNINMPAKQSISPHQSWALFVHDEMLSPNHPLMQKNMQRFFVFDDALHGKWPLKRLQFVADCINDMPEMEVWHGDTREILKQRGVGRVHTQNTPNLLVRELLAPFNPMWEAEVKISHAEISEKRLQRFSRYWEKVGPTILGDDYQARPKS